MRKAFGSIFIGMVFVFLDIRIMGLDVFADPIGYWFVYYGSIRLTDRYSIGKRAKNGALMLAFLSIPAVFISKNAIFHPLSFLGLYMPLLHFLTIIAVLFLFQLMLQIAHRKGLLKLYKQTRLFSISYIAVMILIFLLQVFLFPETDQAVYMVILSLMATVFNIIFLVWLFRFRMLQN